MDQVRRWNSPRDHASRSPIVTSGMRIASATGRWTTMGWNGMTRPFAPTVGSERGERHSTDV